MCSLDLFQNEPLIHFLSTNSKGGGGDWAGPPVLHMQHFVLPVAVECCRDCPGAQI